MKQFFVLILLSLGTNFALAAPELPPAFEKYQIEANVIKKFISLESEHDSFYRINDIEVSEITDSYLKKPGYSIQINYSTPECKNNYFKGLAYSIHCNDDECPFGMVYRQCYEK